ncbi:hypothetical protein [Bacillus cereus]|uniref:hypothetical protein n=1 Tax=Bacillus cereus TaxID=1396 RepID=UPI000BF4A2EC|nr:hypothetical protein [Bacillus cereus]PER08879.1 hypothetical protein CN489_24880 [Bacillus cereus]PFF53753.1 hypothetical protein CN350_27150 [Bacillus cereus]PGM85733.1 hypothetical protein CN956_00435 [Bacillus cereus]
MNLKNITQEQCEESQHKRKKGRTRTIEVYKDGVHIETIEGLLNTFKWANENGIANEGWVKESLRSGRETIAGRKYKTGGYLFKYTE